MSIIFTVHIRCLSMTCAAIRYFHMTCHIGGLTCLILGMVAIVDYKAWAPHHPTEFPFQVMYSAHSWLGVLTIATWCVQLVFSIVIYYFMEWTSSAESQATKKVCVEVHHFIGHCVFAMGLATCATGLQDMQSSDLASAAMSVSDDEMGENMTMAVVTNISMTMAMATDDGYTPGSLWSNLASSGTILLLALGVSTFASLKFVDRKQVSVECNRKEQGVVSVLK
jgi:Eukaryotic cytochrome b561